jgi:hypothetical protein
MVTMTKNTPNSSNIGSHAGAWMMTGYGPKATLAPPGEGGSDAEKAAADKAAADKAAADKLAADKAAADKAAADKVAADKAAADKLAAEKAAEEARKGLTDKEAALLKEVMEKKDKLKSANDALAEATEKLKAYEGLDPAKAKELLAAQDKAVADKKAAEEAALVKAGEFDRLKKMMADEHKKIVDGLGTEIKTTKTALDTALQTIDDLTIGAEFTSSQFIANELVLTPRVARSEYGSYFERENGVIVAYDKPKNAQTRTKLVDASGEPLKFDAAMRKLIDAAPDKDQLLKSKLKVGARSNTNNNVNVRAAVQNDGEPRGAARMAAALSKGALSKAK